MNDRSKSAERKDPRVEAALREFLERVDRGEPVDRDEFLARHAAIAEQLRSFIAAEEDMRKLAAAGADTPHDQTRDSTKSIVGHGQETVVPQLMGKRNVLSGTRGLEGRFGRYRVIRALGKGAMGAVYLAEDTQIERQVALKTPHFTEDPTGEQMERFFREARAAGNLRHPNICPIYDFGQIDGRHFITMAYIEGRPLSAFIQPDNQQAERQILLLVRKLASALQEAHDHGVVHRDLKPANIMVDKKGEPIIMDFGLAQQTGPDEDVRLTQTGNILGTPAFMSPEQVEGEPEKIGPPSDQYSLGVILYELLTAQLPFRGSVLGVMGQILTKEPPPPSQLRPDLDARIEAVCLKMMAKNPAERFRSLKAAADEISSILKSPAAKTASKEQPASSPAPSPTGDRTRADAGASQVLKSLKQKTLSETDLESLEELARKCYSRRDFEQVIQIIERVPEKRRNPALQALLEKSRSKTDEISFLICEIDEAIRLSDRGTALKKADELLKIKPGHHRALKVQEEFAGYGEGRAARLGPLRQFTQPWNEGGWIPWSVLAFGLAVFALMYGVVVIYLGKTAIVIDIKDPGVKVAVKGATVIVTGPDMQSVTVVPGDQELTITCAGFETVTKSFSLKKGNKKTVTISIVDSKLVASLDHESAPLTAAREEKMSSATASGGRPLDPLLPEHKATANAAKANSNAPQLLVAPFDEATAKKGQDSWSAILKTPVQQANSIGMKLMLIPPGEYLMGLPASQVEESQTLISLPIISKADKTGILAAEQPQHRVRITHAFYFGQFEVTRGQFAEFVRATGYKTEAERNAQPANMTAGESFRAKWNWRYDKSQDNSHPVHAITWGDATAFCTWLSQNERKTYRLPTEAEWEYACRAGTESLFYFGNDPEMLTRFENVADARFEATYRSHVPGVKSSDGWAGTSPVGRFRPNAFGLYDMLGNVREWCQDWFAEDYYAGSPVDDPPGPVGGMEREPKRWEEQIAHERLGLRGTFGLAGDVRGSLRVIRGGSYGLVMGPADDRSSSRSYITPAFWASGLGFRVVCEIDAAKALHAAATSPVSPQANQRANVVIRTPLVAPKRTVTTTPAKISRRPFLVRGEWRIEGDELVQPTLAEGWWRDLGALIVLGEETLSNYDLTFEIKKTGGRGAMGIFFHWQGPGDDRYFNLGGNGGTDFGYNYLGKWGREEGNWKWRNYASNQWYSLKLEVRDSDFRAYLDGELQYQLTDARFTHGRLCLYTDDTAARFRRIKVSDPEGRVLFEGLPELRRNSNITIPKANNVARSHSLTAGETAAQSSQKQSAQHLKAAVISTNSLGMKLALIPPGEFAMGSHKSERERGGIEQQHRVRITSPFYLGVYEVTQTEFEQVMGRNPSYFSNSGGPAEAETGVDTKRNPVESVTWYDALEFCNKLSEKDGRRPYYRLADIQREHDGWIKNAKVYVEGGAGYRLPTEAQWEYACRAGTTTPFYFGTAANGAEFNCDGKLPYGTKEQGPALGRTVPVGGYGPNAFGLYDMYGNVNQWCWDLFDPAYYKHSLKSDPTGPSGGAHRVCRGGAWPDRAADCRSAARREHAPGDRGGPGCHGIRVARSAGE